MLSHHAMSNVSSPSTAGAVSVVGVPGSRSVARHSLLLLALLAACTAVLASSSSSSSTCPQLPLARVVVFIPPLFRLGQSLPPYSRLYCDCMLLYLLDACRSVVVVVVVVVVVMKLLIILVHFLPKIQKIRKSH